MRTKRLLFILIPTLSLCLAGLAWSESDEDDEGAEEGAIALTDAPQAVQNAVKALTPADKVTEVECEIEDGVTVYDVEYKTDAGIASVVLAESGEILATERAMTAEGLPAAVRKTLSERFKGAKVVEAEAITMHYFEVKLKIGDGQREVKILASGQIAEDDESADEDHDGDEEDHDGDDDGEREEDDD